MAHAEKFTKSAIFGIANHIERKTENHSNKDIDISRTKDNYSLLNDNSDLITRLNNRLAEVHVYNRADVNVMVDWVVTLPNELKEATAEQQREFFINTHDFMTNRYGGLKNVVSSEIHVDETTPHLHFAFIPVVFDEKRQQERVQANKVIDRTELRVFHDDLHAYLLKNIPGIYKKGILNDKTIGLDKVSDIKRLDSAIKNAKQEKEKVLKGITAYKNPSKDFDEIIEKSSRSIMGLVQLKKQDLNIVQDLIMSSQKMSSIHLNYKKSSEKEIADLNRTLKINEKSFFKAKRDLENAENQISNLRDRVTSLIKHTQSQQNDFSALEILTTTDFKKTIKNIDYESENAVYLLARIKNGDFNPTRNNLHYAKEVFESVPKNSLIINAVTSALNFVLDKLDELAHSFRRSGPRL